MRTIGTKTMLACMLAIAAGSTTASESAATQPAPQEASMLTAAMPHRCDYAAAEDPANPGFLTVDENDFARKCLSPRGNANDIVRIPKYAADFASRCAIRLIDENIDYVDAPHVCAPKDPTTTRPFIDGDRVMVTDWGHDKYTLTRRRGLDSLVIPLTVAASMEGGTPFLSGSEGDTTYFVYIEYVEAVQGRFEKHYRFEVFERDVLDPPKCEMHKPTYRPKIQDCVLNVGPNASETGTSTGGEPPPK